MNITNVNRITGEMVVLFNVEMTFGDVIPSGDSALKFYLCDKYSFGALYPTDAKQRFDAERWMDWQQSELNRASGPPFVQWIRTAPEQRNLVLIEEYTRKMNHWLGIVEAHLAIQPYMAGQTLTMADIPLLCEVHRWWAVRKASGESNTTYPAIERWYAPLLAHPASKGVLDVPVS